MGNFIARVTMLATAFGGQEIVNSFWYRKNGPSTSAEEEAIRVISLFDNLVVPAMQLIQTNNWALHDEEVMIWDDDTWEPMLAQPAIFPRNVVGDDTTHDVNGPAQCLIVKFALDGLAASIPTGYKLPRRSYIAVGPVAENKIDTAGNVVLASFPASTLPDFLDAVAADLLDGPVIYEAVRVGVAKPGQQVRAYAGIISASLRTKSSFRRSRNN